jgi:hypothetical protein
MGKSGNGQYLSDVTTLLGTHDGTDTHTGNWDWDWDWDPSNTPHPFKQYHKVPDSLAVKTAMTTPEHLQ